VPPQLARMGASVCPTSSKVCLKLLKVTSLHPFCTSNSSSISEIRAGRGWLAPPHVVIGVVNRTEADDAVPTARTTRIWDLQTISPEASLRHSSDFEFALIERWADREGSTFVCRRCLPRVHDSSIPSSSSRCTHCSGVPHAIMRGYDRDVRGCGLQCGWCVTLLGLVSTIFAVVYAVLPGLRGSAYSESMCTVVDVEATEFFYCRCASYCRTVTRCAWSHPSPLATRARAHTHKHTK
jgi:hypothetical protein